MVKAEDKGHLLSFEDVKLGPMVVLLQAFCTPIRAKARYISSARAALSSWPPTEDEATSPRMLSEHSKTLKEANHNELL